MDRTKTWADPGRGFGTKIHAAFDALGNPVAFHSSPGQDADITQAEQVIGDRTPGAVLGDKGYDRDAFVNNLKKRGIEVVIPPKKNRVYPREYDTVLYKGETRPSEGSTC